MRVSLVLDLLDNQVVDADGVPLGRIDDLEVALPASDGGGSGEGGDDPGTARGPVPQVVAIVTGAEVLGTRVGGVVGRLMSGTARRLRDPEVGSPHLDVALVRAVRPLVRLTAREPELPQVAGLEKWLRRHVVARHGRPA